MKADPRKKSSGPRTRDTLAGDDMPCTICGHKDGDLAILLRVGDELLKGGRQQMSDFPSSDWICASCVKAPVNGPANVPASDLAGGLDTIRGGGVGCGGNCSGNSLVTSSILGVLGVGGGGGSDDAGYVWRQAEVLTSMGPVAQPPRKKRRLFSHAELDRLATKPLASYGSVCNMLASGVHEQGESVREGHGFLTTISNPLNSLIPQQTTGSMTPLALTASATIITATTTERIKSTVKMRPMTDTMTLANTTKHESPSKDLLASLSISCRSSKRIPGLSREWWKASTKCKGESLRVLGYRTGEGRPAGMADAIPGERNRYKHSGRGDLKFPVKRVALNDEATLVGTKTSQPRLGNTRHPRIGVSTRRRSSKRKAVDPKEWWKTVIEGTGHREESEPVADVEELPRLPSAPLGISRVFFENVLNGIVEVFADTLLGKFTIHELVIREHFDECCLALGDVNITRGWPHLLACRIQQLDWQVQGFVSAYDVNNPENSYRLEFEDSRDCYWGTGADFEIETAPQRVGAPHADMLFHQKYAESRPLRVLEVCCGGKSFTRQLIRMFPTAEVTTLDILEENDPDIVADICIWDYCSCFLPGYFDIIWLSPPCTEYSPAKTCGERNIPRADTVAQAALRLIKLAEPPVWFMENPHTKLFKRPFMFALGPLRNRCTYCRYGFTYRKDTDIWSNIPLSLLHCDDTHCASKAELGRHVCSAQQGTRSCGTPGVRKHQSNSIPVKLLRSLITSAVKYLKDTRGDRVVWTI